MALKVNEIFYSVQGESSFAGRPCVFVRLSGCNLRCTYCDTRYAYHEGEQREIPEIIDAVSAYDCPLVEITGGEPLIQPETPDLVQGLLDRGYTLLMETNGSKDISPIDERCSRIVDIKCPGSGAHLENNFTNIDKLTPRDEVKFVIRDRVDFDFAKDILARYSSRLNNGIQVHFSPVFGQMEPRQLAEWILKEGLNVRLHLQMHKLIWDENKRGV